MAGMMNMFNKLSSMTDQDGNMDLDVYSEGLAIELLRESIMKLNYLEKINQIIQKMTLKIIL